MCDRARSRSPVRQEDARTFRSSNRSTPTSMQPPPSRTFAPGLVLRKKKVDPYDPDSLLSPNSEYTFMQNSTDTTVRGTWSTIDTESGTRQWDRRFEQDRAESKASGSTHLPRSVASRSERDTFASTISSSHSLNRVTSNEGSTVSSPSPYLQNATSDKGLDVLSSSSSDLDVDPSVRALFVDSRFILQENRRPLTNFEKINKSFLEPNYSTPITNIIGGQKVDTLVPNVDTRAEFRDRHGNYIDGQNRGKMKKRYENEWQKRLELLDEELLHATKAKRAWDALPEEEKARRRQKIQRNRSLCMLLGAGTHEAPNSDIYTWENVPEVYTRKNTSHIQSGFPDSNDSAPLDDRSWDYVLLSDDHTPLANSPVPPPVDRSSSLRNSKGSSRRAIPPGRQSTSSVQSIRSRSTIRPAPITALSSRPPSLSLASTPAGHTSNATDNTPILEPGPEVALIADLPSPRRDISDKDDAEHFDRIRMASVRRGRLVSFLLHEPVKYTSSAIVDRVFGGAIQEIQYHPEERLAIVCFVYPAEAAALVRHAKNIKESDGHGYRRLQVDIDWYHGLEIEAVYPAQPRILTAVLAENASRVLLCHGIVTTITTETLAHDFKTRFYDKLLVKVAIVRPSKRYVQARDGNCAVIEFPSIRDCVEIMERFENRQVQDYEHVEVEFLGDSCARQPVKIPYCDCYSCIT